MIRYNAFIRHSSKHFGGPDGETAASLRYLTQRFAMPYREGIATLTDVGTEELSHLEMICAIIHQLTRNLSPEEIKKQGFAEYYVDHTLGVWPQAAGGIPFSSTFFQSKGDPITDLHENMAAEQKARTTYDNILRLTDDPDVLDPIRFLRQREITHFQRFGETLRLVQDQLDSRNFYAFNPAFDTSCRIGSDMYGGKSDDRYSVRHNDNCGSCDNQRSDCCEDSRGSQYANRRNNDCGCGDNHHSSHRGSDCDTHYTDRRSDCCDDCGTHYANRRSCDCNPCDNQYANHRNNDCGCGVTYNGNTGRIIKNG